MKCPKCGFNSFEYYDSCKKCSADLTGHKLAFSLSSLVLPQDAKAALVAQSRSRETFPGETHAAPEIHDDIFSFDLPDDAPPPVNPPPRDPFGFDEPPTAAKQVTSLSPEDHIFGDLLESTPQQEVPSSATKAAAVAPPEVSSSASAGEFDFDSFSWESSPDIPPPTRDTAAVADTTDDFDSFFDDLKEDNSK